MECENEAIYIAYENHQREKNKKRKTLKAKRDYHKHLIFLADHVGAYMSGAYYKEIFWDKNRTPRYVRCYRGRRSKYLKNQCHRKIRRNNKLKFMPLQHNQYRKVTEFWWEYD